MRRVDVLEPLSLVDGRFSDEKLLAAATPWSTLHGTTHAPHE
jgi:hypothetical protein